MSNYINPFTDWGFKRLFGQEFSKDLLIDFLNDLFVDELHIKSVTFKDKEQLPETKDLRGCVFDIYCETDTGEYFIVEMQNNYVPLFVNRTIYYASKAIEAQREKAKTKQFPTLYDLVPVYVVSFMNFDLEKEMRMRSRSSRLMSCCVTRRAERSFPTNFALFISEFRFSTRRRKKSVLLILINGFTF